MSSKRLRRHRSLRMDLRSGFAQAGARGCGFDAFIATPPFISHFPALSISLYFSLPLLPDLGQTNIYSSLKWTVITIRIFHSPGLLSRPNK